MRIERFTKTAKLLGLTPAVMSYKHKIVGGSRLDNLVKNNISLNIVTLSVLGEESDFRQIQPLGWKILETAAREALSATQTVA